MSTLHNWRLVDDLMSDPHGTNAICDDCCEVVCVFCEEHYEERTDCEA